jgi:hypothetical protein
VTALLVAVLLGLSAGASVAQPECAEPNGELNGYQVLDVKIEDPLDFIVPGASPFSSLARSLAIKKEKPFQNEALNKDVEFLGDVLKASNSTSSQVFKLGYVKPRVLACDAKARTLYVSYLVLTNVASAYVVPSLEAAVHEFERPATTGAVRATPTNTSFVPLLGYNATRRTFGGLGFANTTQGLRVNGEASGSGNSLTGRVEVAGMLPGTSTRWRNGELKGAFEYEDTPAGTAKAREGRLALRFSQSTRELSHHIVFRYGAALEGGRQRSEDAVGSVVQNSGYGSLKLYVGATGRRGWNAFTSSYGFQAGTTFTDGVPAFTKHLIDVGYVTKIGGAKLGDGKTFGPISPNVHRSVDVQTRFSAGIIQQSAGTPLAERFLGGNEMRPFVPDDQWVIPADAFIRSIPENALATADGDPGGDRFYAANVRVAWPLWGRPLVPRELALDGNFLTTLNGAFSTAVGTLADNYKAKDPEFKRRALEIPSHARAIRPALDTMTETLKQIPAAIAKGPLVAKPLKDVQNDIRQAKNAITFIETDTAPTTLVNGVMPNLATHIEVLRRNLDAADLANVSAGLVTALARTDAPRAAIKDVLTAFDSNKYHDQAVKTLAPAHNVLDVFLHQLNAYSIAPMGIVDVARISPSAADIRYGVGGGLRFSLVNVNVSAAYVFNVHPVAQEGHGAVFLKLDVTNIFP